MRTTFRTVIFGQLLFVLGFLLQGCWSNDTINSSDVNEDALFGKYTATYTAETAQMSYFAQLTVGGSGGTTVRLNAPSELRVNGSSMMLRDGDDSFINLIGTYYSLSESTISPPASMTFTWIRRDGRAYNNVLQMVNPVAIGSPVSGYAHRKTENLTVTVSGAPLQSGEQYYIALIMQGDANSSQQKTLSAYFSAGQSYTFTTSQLSSLVSGAGTLSIERSRHQNVQQGHPREGGSMSATYKGVPISISLF